MPSDFEYLMNQLPHIKEGNSKLADARQRFLAHEQSKKALAISTEQLRKLDQILAQGAKTTEQAKEAFERMRRASEYMTQEEKERQYLSKNLFGVKWSSLTHEDWDQLRSDFCSYFDTDGPTGWSRQQIVMALETLSERGIFDAVNPVPKDRAIRGSLEHYQALYRDVPMSFEELVKLAEKQNL